MKHSKIFLGVTTCLLAIAGVTAARHYGPSIRRWYCTEGVLGVKHCVPTGTITCVYDASQITTCLYQNQAVFTSGAIGPWSNCKHKFVYSRTD